MPKFDINQKFQYDTCTDHKNVSEIYLCTKKYVDSESLIKAFNDECSNKSHCNFDMKMYLKPNFDHQVKDEDCDLEFSKLYVQYNCDFADKIAKEQLKGLFIAATAIVACIFYRCIIYFLRTTASIDYKLWDIHTVTAADFTVEVNIPEIIWRKWKKRNIKTSFKEYFRNQLQPQIDALPQCLSDPRVNTDTRIACIFFAYANSNLIDVLKERGDDLINGNLAKMTKTESKINSMMEKRSEEFKRPVKAFLTFNT